MFGWLEMLQNIGNLKETQHRVKQKRQNSLRPADTGIVSAHKQAVLFMIKTGDNLNHRNTSRISKTCPPPAGEHSSLTQLVPAKRLLSRKIGKRAICGWTRAI
jgi:hypothetical protein